MYDDYGLGSLFEIPYVDYMPGAMDFGTYDYGMSGPWMADPSFTLTGNGYIDGSGNPVTGPFDYNDSTLSLGASGVGTVMNSEGQSLGFNDGRGNLVDINGNPVRPNELGVETGKFSASNLGALKDALDKLAQAGRSGGGSGGGNAFAMPRIESPVAERINALPVPQASTGAIPAAPQPNAEFRPLVIPNAPAPQAPPMAPRGLAELFNDPYATLRPR